VLELLISGEESHTLNVLIVLDLTNNLIDEESLHSIVELVLPEVAANISHGIVRPVSELNTIDKTIVLSNPQTVLKSFKVYSGVKRIS